MDGIGPGTMGPDHTSHLLIAGQDFHAALMQLRYAETAEDVLKYLPPVLQLANRLVDWPPIGDLGRMHDIYYKWVDAKPEAGHITGFLRARDAVCERGLELYSGAAGWVQAGDAEFARMQGLQLLVNLEFAASNSLDLLSAYAPTAEETQAELAKEKQHREVHLKQQAEERDAEAVPAQFLPQDAEGRIGHVMDVLGPLKTAVSALEAATEPDEILLRVCRLIEAANQVGIGAESEPLDAMWTVLHRWADIKPAGTMATALDEARYTLVPSGWALVHAMELDAEASQGPAGAVTPRTEEALNAFAATAYQAGEQVATA